MAYEPYVTPEYYQSEYGGNVVPADDLKKALRQASRHVDSLTYNRIVGQGFSKLTDFQQEVIREVVCQQADFETEKEDEINTVLQKGVNDKEWKSLAELAKKNKLDVRFIELMPIGQGRAEDGISGAWVLGKLKEAYGIEGEFYPLEGRFGNGPAVYYQLPGFQGKIGLISALHGKFCDRCNRIRMTSTGKLKACLCYADTISVFEAARHGSEEEIRKCLEQAIRGKPKMHHFEEQNFITEQKNMSQIGG